MKTADYVSIYIFQNIKLRKDLRMQQIQRRYCPVCGSKTRDRNREDTVLKNYPLYCPKCKRETLINAKELQITVIKEPDA